MIPIAELAAYRDIPVFGWLSNEESLDDKNKLQTLVRSIAPLSSIGNPPPNETLSIVARSVSWMSN